MKFLEISVSVEFLPQGDRDPKEIKVSKTGPNKSSREQSRDARDMNLESETPDGNPNLVPAPKLSAGNLNRLQQLQYQNQQSN